MKLNVSSEYNKPNRGLLFLAAVAFPVQLLYFPALTVYLSNTSEMRAVLFDMLILGLLPVLIIIVAVIVLLKLSPSKIKISLIALLSAISALVWLQGNVILWEYGVLDGRSIDWDAHRGRGWVDGLIWILVITISLVTAQRYYKAMVKIAGALLLLQGLSSLVLLAQHYESLPQEQDLATQDDLQQLYKFSRNNNVLHLVVDGFQADVFDFLMNQPKYGDTHKKAFKGFTFFRENLGVFPYTRFSVPAFLSGEIYKNSEAKDTFIDRIMAANNILNMANDAGYEVDLGVGGEYWVKRYSNAKYRHIYSLDHDVAINPVHEDVAMVLDLALFRSVPHFLKPLIYNDQAWLISEAILKRDGSQHWYFKHTRFLHALISGMAVERDKPVYKYIHIMNTHNPMVVNRDCEYAGKVLGMTRLTLTYQANCTMYSLELLLLRMKELGIYDDMLIIIHGDHGGWAPNYRQGPPIRYETGKEAPLWISSLASPLLAIKLPQAKHGFQTSDQLTTLQQLPATIADVLGWENDFGMESIYSQKGMARTERNFYFYGWQRDAWETDYANPIQVFNITGSHYENEWKLSELYRPPKR